MTPKFYEGQRVSNVYLGVQGVIGTVQFDTTPPRYDLVYDGSEATYTAIESVLSDDLTQPSGVPAIEASLLGVAQLTEMAIGARIVGILTNYQCERITEIAQDAKHAIYTRASLPTDYL